MRCLWLNLCKCLLEFYEYSIHWRWPIFDIRCLQSVEVPVLCTVEHWMFFWKCKNVKWMINRTVQTQQHYWSFSLKKENITYSAGCSQKWMFLYDFATFRAAIINRDAFSLVFGNGLGSRLLRPTWIPWNFIDLASEHLSMLSRRSNPNITIFK